MYRFLVAPLAVAPLLFVAAHANEAQEPAPIPFEVVTDIRQTMEYILEPAAEVVWDSAGAVISEAGEQDLSPETDEGWTKVLNASALLAEGGNLMMIPGRSAGPDWNQHAKRMTVAAKQAMDAAEATHAKPSVAAMSS